MNVLSLFDGMSCGQIALDKIGIKVNNYFASEIKPFAITVTMDNYPNTIQLGDITKIAYHDKHILLFDSAEAMRDYIDNGNGQPIEKIFVDEIDLLIGGSPCQNLSGANNEKHRLGLEGEKSKLFYEYYRLLQEVKPKYYLLENVGSMKNVDRDIITDLLGNKPIKINSSLVSAQSRNRYYWTNIPNVTQPEDQKITLQDILTEGYADREKSRCILESWSRPNTTPIKIVHRYYSIGLTQIIYKSEQHYKDCKKHYDTHFKGKSAKQIDELMVNMDMSVYDGVRNPNRIEMERLQTVPEGYTNSVKEKESASLLGDGWTVDVIAHIFKNLK